MKEVTTLLFTVTILTYVPGASAVVTQVIAAIGREGVLCKTIGQELVDGSGVPLLLCGRENPAAEETQREQDQQSQRRRRRRSLRHHHYYHLNFNVKSKCS